MPPVPCRHRGDESDLVLGETSKGRRRNAQLALPGSSDGHIDGAKGNRLPGACPSPPASSRGRRKTTDA